MIESNELQSMIPKKAKSLEQRMKELINTGDVMIFMKGNRNEPRCGFSRTLMEIFLGKLLNWFRFRNIGVKIISHYRMIVKICYQIFYSRNRRRIYNLRHFE